MAVQSKALYKLDIYYHPKFTDDDDSHKVGQ